MEATDVKAYVTDKNSNHVPNINVSWKTSAKPDIKTVITDINGIAKKKDIENKFL